MADSHNVYPINPSLDKPSQNKGWFERFREDRRFSWPATLAASAIATGAVGYAIHGPNYHKGSLGHTLHTALTWEPELTYEKTIGHQNSRKGGYVSNTKPVGTVGHTSIDLQSPAEVWAQNFAQDPHAGELVNPHALEGVVAQLAHIAASGNRIFSIKVSGFASAEDDQPGGGFQKPSAKNAQLALKRADTVATDLLNAIDSYPALRKALINDDIQQGRIVEQELTDQQVNHLDAIAKKSGYRQAIRLVNAWNLSPESINKSDAAYLEHLLGRARKVEIDIIWGRPHHELYERDVYCARYLITNTLTEKITKKDNVDWPIPIIIPIWLKDRRKRKTEESDEDEDKDTAKQRYVGGAATMWAIRGALTSAAAAGLLFNLSGENCHGGHHGPRPLLVDLIWESIDESNGNGADINQTFSFGIPFVSQAQVNLASGEGNFWGLDGQKACEIPPKKTINKIGGKCLVIAIAETNGKEVRRKVLNQVPPIKTTTATKP